MACIRKQLATLKQLARNKMNTGTAPWCYSGASWESSMKDIVACKEDRMHCFSTRHYLFALLIYDSGEWQSTQC